MIADIGAGGRNSPAIPPEAGFVRGGPFKQAPLADPGISPARFLSELKAFIRIPSISAQPEHAADVKRCAAWLADHLGGIGMQGVTVIPTARHPLVWAEWRGSPGRPTVLIYGHYDVQPAEPGCDWSTPPFQPTVRGDYLHGRGASDDKGPLLAHLNALETHFRNRGQLPVNVICLFEGAEEIGSPGLRAFLSKNRKRLTADVAIVSDTRIPAPDQPALTYALRGSLSMELTVNGPQRDLHSGSFGGAVYNPAQALCEILAGLHDIDGRVAVPGFYDRVRPPSQAERAYLRRAGPSAESIMHAAEVDGLWGEPGFTPYERTTLRPALTINGVTGGYGGPGPKGVIPASATAKLNFRLVPDQDPEEIARLFRRHVAQATPAAVRARLRTESCADPALVALRHPAVRAAAVAYQESFGARPIFLRSGGSIPVVSMFQDILDLPTILMGFALPDDGMHGPNERVHLPTLLRGIATSMRFLSRLGRFRTECWRDEPFPSETSGTRVRPT
jgi:acetylornithine deacetylase/succinyl-diaminopimelate desuccinylase-like protein